MGEIFFTTGFLILQIVLVFLCFYRSSLEIAYRSRPRQVLAFLSAQLLCVFFLFLGGYLETRGNFYSNIVGLIDKHRYLPPEAFEVEGDPALVQLVQKQQPDLHRPDLTNAEALRIWQSSLRRTLLNVFNISDITSSVDVYFQKLSSMVVAQNITRTFLTFKSFDGTSIPAYLFVPLPNGPKPAIIVLHGHVGENDEGITQTAGLIDSYQHKAALALARAGYVTLTIEFRGFGYLGPQVNTEHRLVAYNAILGGSFYKAIISKDIKYAFDLLQSLEEVDSKRIGITGVSYGGEMAAVYAALDERIKVIVFQGFGGELGVKQGVIGTSSDQPHYDHIIPGYNKYLLQEDIFLLIAPRPLLGIRGDQDYSGNQSFSEVVTKAYKVLHVSSLFRFEIVPGGHEYFVQPAIRFFKQYL